MTDSIADFLTRIRNAIRAGHESVEIDNSRIKIGIVEILKREGYVLDYSVIDDRKSGILKIYLRYLGPMNNVIRGLKRESSPGRRIYLKWNKIPKVLGGLGISILSTSKGVITDNDARKMKVGGELICSVW
jgi:small subunit ribosomal protein S8